MVSGPVEAASLKNLLEMQIIKLQPKLRQSETWWMGLGAAPVASFNKPLGDSDVNESEGTPVVAYPFLKRT